MTLTTTISLQINAALQSALDLVTSKAEHAYQKILELANGSGASQASLIFSDSRQIAASGTDDLDLAGGLTDPLGAVLTFTKIKAIVVFAKATNTNNVVVGGAAANQFVGPFGAATHTVSIPAGGLIVLTAPSAAGWAVTAGTGDLLRVANSAAGTAVDYDIILIGA